MSAPSIRRDDPWNPAAWSADVSAASGLPKVTLAVLSHNRCSELQRTLDVLAYGVQYPDYEILVVDNGSTDGTSEMVREQFPFVKLISLSENFGVSARNEQFQGATGKYLFSFDDDTFPGTPSMVLRIVKHLEAHPDIDVLSTRYYQTLTGITETEGWESFGKYDAGSSGYRGIFVVEGGVVYRMQALQAGIRYDPRWIGQEGMELGIQFYKQNRKLVLCQQFVTLHFVSPAPRAFGRTYRGHRAYVNSRQTIWMVAKHWPAPIAILLLPLVLTRRIIALMMHRRTWRENLHGIRDGLGGITPFLRERPKLSVRQVIALTKFYLFLFRWA